MDRLEAQHKSLEAGRWAQMSFANQMGNIGSEVSRAIKWRSKSRPDRAERAFFRALELMDLSIAAAAGREGTTGRLRELCRAREELCDYFAGSNLFRTKPDQLMNYYDRFDLLGKKEMSSERK